MHQCVWGNAFVMFDWGLCECTAACNWRCTLLLCAFRLESGSVFSDCIETASLMRQRSADSCVLLCVYDKDMIRGQCVAKLHGFCAMLNALADCSCAVVSIVSLMWCPLSLPRHPRGAEVMMEYLHFGFDVNLTYMSHLYCSLYDMHVLCPLQPVRQVHSALSGVTCANCRLPHSLLPK